MDSTWQKIDGSLGMDYSYGTIAVGLGAQGFVASPIPFIDQQRPWQFLRGSWRRHNAIVQIALISQSDDLIIGKKIGGALDLYYAATPALLFSSRLTSNRGEYQIAGEWRAASVGLNLSYSSDTIKGKGIAFGVKLFFGDKAHFHHQTADPGWKTWQRKWSQTELAFVETSFYCPTPSLRSYPKKVKGEKGRKKFQKKRNPSAPATLTLTRLIGAGLPTDKALAVFRLWQQGKNLSQISRTLSLTPQEQLILKRFRG